MNKPGAKMDIKGKAKSERATAYRSVASGHKPSFREGSDIGSIWKEEIEALKCRNFSTVEEAYAFISERVVSRLNLEKAQLETRIFVQELLASHPEFADQLRSSLNIKSSH